MQGILASDDGSHEALAVKREMLPAFDVGQVIEKVRHAVTPDDHDPTLWRSEDAVYRAIHQGRRFAFVPRDVQGEAGQPLEWRTVSIRSGQTEMAAATPKRERHENQVRLQWNGVRERYDHRAGHVEQSWDVERLPEPGRDLVITGQMAGAVLVEKTDSGLHFETPGGQLVAYSRATVYDARGRVLHVDPQWNAEQLTITVDGAWLAKASLPVTVDPTFMAEQGIDNPVTPLVTTDTARNDLAPAIAFDGTNYLVVWVEGGVAAPAGSGLAERQGIFGTIVEPDGDLLTSAGFGVSVGDYADWGQPAATSDGSNWYVVWTDKRSSLSDPFVLRGVLVNDTDLSNIALTEVTLSDEGLANNPTGPTNPDVGSDGSGFLVVFEGTDGASSDIFYRFVSSSGALEGANPTNLTSNGSTAQSRPAVSGVSARYAVVWVKGASGALEGRAFQSGAFEGSSFNIAATNTDATTYPDIDCAQVIEVEMMASVSRFYCTVVWSGDLAGASAGEGKDIFAQRLEIGTMGLSAQGSQENLLTTADANTTGGVNNTGDQTQPTVSRVTTASGDTAHTIAYIDENSGSGDVKILFQLEGVDSDDFTALMGRTITSGADAELGPVVARTDSSVLVAWTNTTARNVEANAIEVDAMMMVTDVDLTVNLRANAQVAPAVATNGSNVLLAWSDDRGGSFDVHVARIDVDGTVLDSTSTAVSTNTTDDEFRVTTCASGSDYLVAWVRDDNVLEAQRVQSDGTTNGTVITVSSGGANDVYGALDCEGNGTDWVVAWRTTNTTSDTDTVNSIQVRSGGTTRNNVTLETSTAGNLGDPAVSAGAASTARFVVVWPGVGASRIQARRLSSNGSTTGSLIDVVTTGTITSLDVAEVGQGYGIGWIDTSGTDAVKLLFASEAFSVITPNGGSTLQATNGIDNLRLDAVDTGHVALVWQTPGNGGFDLAGAESFVSSDGVTLIGSAFAINDTELNEGEPRIASNDGKAFIAFQRFVPGEDVNTDRSRVRIGTYNRRPVAAVDTYSTDEDAQLTVSMASAGVLDNDSDPDMDTLSVDATLEDDVNNGSLSLNSANGTFTYTPNQDFNGTDSFSYRATDGNLTSDPVTVTITVNPQNDRPVANNDTSPGYTVNEDTMLQVSLAADGVLDNDTDIDGDALTAVLDDDVNNGTLSLNPNGTFTYQPNPDFNGTDSFTYFANDGNLNSSTTATVLITVNAVNDRPVAVNDPTTPGDPNYTVDEDGTLNVSAGAGVLANDTDVDLGDTLDATSVSSASSGTLNLNTNTGAFSYEPEQDFNGTVTFTYRVTDGSLTSSNTATVTITVSPINDAPIATGETYNATEETLLSINTANGVLDNDVDPDTGDDLDVEIVSDVSNGTLSMNTETGAFTYDPDPNFFGTDSFTYKAVDSSMVDSNTVTVTINVANTPDAPVAVGDTYSTSEEVPLNVGAGTGVLANDSDPDGDDLDIIVITNVSDGTLNPDLETGAFIYTPDPNFNGTDSFTYQATDGARESSTVTVTISVNNTDDAPTVAW
ncbi:MAG: cadherin-like domain-containing protein [Myxococcota bacterium]